MLVQLFTILFWLLYVHSCTPSSIVPFLPNLLGNIWKGGGWIKRPSRGSVCFHMLFLFVQAFPFLISHHCQWSPYALGTGKLFDLEGGLWSCICKKLILQSYSCFIEVCSGGKVVIKTQISIEFLHKLGNKKRNAIQLSRHKVWYAH